MFVMRKSDEVGEVRGIVPSDYQISVGRLPMERIFTMFSIHILSYMKFRIIDEIYFYVEIKNSFRFFEIVDRMRFDERRVIKPFENLHVLFRQF